MRDSLFMKEQDAVQSIMDSLRRIVRALRTASRTSENELGLRAAQLFVLQQLHKYEPLSLNEQAEKTYSHQSTVSVVVNSLVKLNLVRRSASKKDRRFLVLETTGRARALLKRRNSRLAHMAEVRAPGFLPERKSMPCRE